MKGLFIAAGTAAFVVAAVFLVQKVDEPSEPTAVTGEAPLAKPIDGRALRNQLLHATPQQLGITPVRGVWGVLMERGYPKGVATVVALADGTASMYLSTGGSAVGGNAYEPAREAALKLCAQAADLLGDTTPAHDFPPPAQGRVRFYVLSDGGVRTAEDDVLPRADAGDALAPLLAAGDAVLDGLKEATSRGLIQ
jgi:hypothetical protein